jgi:hypothetical protein
MNKWIVLASLVLAAGCRHHRTIVVEERHDAAPPPASSTPVVVTTGAGTIGWTHVRHVVYTEYYGCSAEEVYYLERTGYDDDDLLVLSFIARRAAVPLRYACFEYDRCGRSLFSVAIVFGVDPFDFYCHEVPVGYACPGPYGRAYGYYWRRERVFLSNAECHALVHLQIGVRYYGHPHAVYFQRYDECRRRAEPHPFRAVAVRDYAHCGRGNVTVNNTVIVKQPRPWEAPRVSEWEERRRREQESVRVRVTVEREREEEARVRRDLDDANHRQRVEESRARLASLRQQREVSDRTHPPRPEEEPRRPSKFPDPAPAPERRPEKKPEPAPGRKPDPAPERKPEAPPPPPERKPEKRPEPAPERKPERKPEPAPPPPERKPERKPEAPPPPPERKSEKRPEPAPERKPDRKPPGKSPEEGPSKDRGREKKE